ncbi:MAG: TetR/AcrR family transcriptional regulator [Ilumatobacteraceae bacterium]
MAGPKARGDTRGRILESATLLFGIRGFDAVSLDQIAAEVGVAKQTLLYWFPSREELLQEVLAGAAAELVVIIEAAIRSASDDPLERIDAVIRAVFRPAVRRPSLLGLLREIGRLPPDTAEALTVHLQPLVDRAVSWMEAEMMAGRLRRGDPKMVVALVYSTVVGVATEPEALRAVRWTGDLVGLRRLRSEMTAFIRSALRP